MGINHQEAELMIEDCIERYKYLTELEEKFIYLIRGKHNPLTQKQLDELEQIWDRVTDGF